MSVFQQPEASAHNDVVVCGAVVEATDIPILSASNRLQAALLKWVDCCGISGRMEFSGNVTNAIETMGLLDERSYVLGINGSNSGDWPILWSGANVGIESGREFGPEMSSVIQEARLTSLIALEYSDAVRYRRAAARRFCLRSVETVHAVDQLIFPLCDSTKADYVLVIGERVSGAMLYDAEPQAESSEVGQ